MRNNYVIIRKVDPTIESYRKLYMTNQVLLKSLMQLRSTVTSQHTWQCENQIAQCQVCLLRFTTVLRHICSRKKFPMCKIIL